jgi:hypothetical protein
MHFRGLGVKHSGSNLRVGVSFVFTETAVKNPSSDGEISLAGVFVGRGP